MRQPPGSKRHKPLTKLVGCGAEPEKLNVVYWYPKWEYGPLSSTNSFYRTAKYLGREYRHYKITNSLISTCRKCSHQQRARMCGDYKNGRKWLCDTCLAVNGIVW